MFSGINLLRDKRSVIGVTENNPFSGINDINYHPVNEHAVYRNSQRKDSFNKTYRRSLETEYMGIMYFHLKGLKSGLCAPEFPAENFSSRDGKPFEETKIVSFEEFCSAQCHQRLRRQLNPYHRLFSVLYTGERMREWKYRLTGAPPRLAQVRLARLAKDLDGIDFKRDVLDPLDAWEFNPDALHAK
ncbi:MAG: hypothetical protein OXU62_06280 [Gammaproteobacteria bacterium]|nr:hypothetical protein [Gammaproteobacteria bacterium]